ncbi:site-specific integrase [Clostridium sp. D2Q-14]|uniref:site-specific integrase n=1 Tax=Anaeromonas gelatinilytica TaxID=2683194 RepID=UPI00193BF743|nr:site-specific integrase [Anaeromonas gelatinilytica]MBS4535182.1 site-specific integrase [Anaeromonas gelatinilytica]
MQGHVRKRGKKWCFVVDVPSMDGKRKQKWYSGYKTKKEAQKALSKVLNEINTNTLVIPDDSTLGEYLTYWLNMYKDKLSPTTIAGYTIIIEKHLIPSLGKIKLAKLKPLMVQDYYNKKKLSERTLLNHHRLLRKALEDARKWQMIHQNVCDLVNSPKPKKYTAKVLEPSDISKLLATLEGNRLYIPIALLLMLGLRRGELLGLKWSDIDFKKKILHIRRNLVMDEDSNLVIKDPKNETSKRDLPLSDRAIELFKKQRKENLEMQLYIEDYKESEYVFVEPNGDRMNPNNFSKRFNYFVNRNGFKGLRVHDLRHTNATIMLSSGVPAKVASKRLGHSNISTTMDIYSHVLDDLNEEATQKIEEKMFK